MVTCTECGGEIEPLTKYLVGIALADVFSTVTGNEPVTLYAFTWACEHHPAPDAPIRLASKACMEKFCEQHPEYVETIIDLLSRFRVECNHALVN